MWITSIGTPKNSYEQNASEFIFHFTLVFRFFKAVIHDFVFRWGVYIYKYKVRQRTNLLSRSSAWGSLENTQMKWDKSASTFIHQAVTIKKKFLKGSQLEICRRFNGHQVSKTTIRCHIHTNKLFGTMSEESLYFHLITNVSTRNVQMRQQYSFLATNSRWVWHKRKHVIQGRTSCPLLSVELALPLPDLATADVC